MRGVWMAGVVEESDAVDGVNAVETNASEVAALQAKLLQLTGGWGVRGAGWKGVGDADGWWCV